jgi:hypothetical protein
VCEIGLLKAETVNRRPSRPRPTPQLLQAETHRLGLMKTGERKGKKMEERTEKRGRAEEKKWKRENIGQNERERKKKKKKVKIGRSKILNNPAEELQ